jgi:hypothetical protein
MPWKQVAIPPNKCEFVKNYGTASEEIQIEKMLVAENKRNFEVPLKYGVFKALNGGFLSEDFSINTKLGGDRDVNLIGYLLKSQKEDNCWTKQTLQFITSRPIDNKRFLRYLVNISSSTIKSDAAGGWYGELELTPILPEKIAKAKEKGIDIDGGFKVIEKIDPMLNEMTFAWAETLQERFGIVSKSIDKKCIKQVCIKNRKIDFDGIMAILHNQNVAIQFKQTTSWRTEGHIVIWYKKNYPLEIYGSFSNHKNLYNDFIALGMIDTVKGALRAAEVAVDEKPINFQESYTSGIQAKIGHAINYLSYGVAIPFLPIGIYLYERDKAKEQKFKLIKERCRKVGALAAMVKEPEGLCVAMIDEACILRKGEVPKNDKSEKQQAVQNSSEGVASLEQ